MTCKKSSGILIAFKIMNKKIRKLWGLEVGGVQREKKEGKNVFCKLENLFLFR
jgi:hypothetical protein